MIKLNRHRATFPVPHQPPAGGDQGQSRQTRSDRGRQGHRRRRSCSRPRRRRETPVTGGGGVSGHGQQKLAGRPDPDGNLVGLGGDPATAAGATRRNLMPRARSEHTDNLILIAATTILLLTAQRYFQTFARPRSVRARGRRRPRRSRANLRSAATGGTRSSPFQIPWAGWKDILWRTYQRIQRRPPARHRGRRGVLRPARGVPGRHRAGLLLWAVRRSLDHRRQSADAGADAAGGLVPDRAGPDRAGARQRQHGAGLRPSCSAFALAIWSANAGRQGRDRRAQRGL